MYAFKTNSSIVCPPSRTRVGKVKHPSQGCNPYPVELCQIVISMWQNGEDIRCEDIPICCDSAFAQKKEFSIFEFPERFSEISCRDLIIFSLC
jgi:hypothetical protein